MDFNLRVCSHPPPFSKQRLVFLSTRIRRAGINYGAVGSRDTNKTPSSLQSPLRSRHCLSRITTLRRASFNMAEADNFEEDLFADLCVHFQTISILRLWQDHPTQVEQTWDSAFAPGHTQALRQRTRVSSFSIIAENITNYYIVTPRKKVHRNLPPLKNQRRTSRSPTKM